MCNSFYVILFVKRSCFMKKFMVLMASCMIGTSCFAMDQQEGKPPLENRELQVATASRLLSIETTSKAVISYIIDKKSLPQIVTALKSISLPTEPTSEKVVPYTTGQMLFPTEIWFFIIGGENYDNLKRIAPLRVVSKTWCNMIDQYFTNVSKSAGKRADELTKEIVDINALLEKNTSGKEDENGFKGDKLSLDMPLSRHWGNWDQSARDLFGKNLLLASKLIKNECSIMVAMGNVGLYKLIASNPTNRTEIEKRGQELLSCIKDIRRNANTVAISFPEKSQEKESLTLMNKLLAKDITKLEGNVDIFGTKAKKPRSFAVKRVAPKGDTSILEELQDLLRK